LPAASAVTFRQRATLFERPARAWARGAMLTAELIDPPYRDAARVRSYRLPGREGARMIARHHARRHNRMSQA